jgi:hypothetical protein
MADWAELLQHLGTGPREDGTPQLQAAAEWLAAELTRRGLNPEHLTWLAHPWRLRTLGVVALCGAAAYVAAMLRKRHALAAAIALAVPLGAILELDFGVPLWGPLHSVEQQNLAVTLPSTEAPRSRLIFSAHYDTKTDFLDHVERAPINFAGLPLTLLMLVAALRPRPRLTKVAVVGAALNGLGLFLAQTAGAFVPERSPGAIDDGASCALLLELGSRFKLQPLAHTEVRLVFFSGEEIGIEGARAFVKTLDRTLPTKVLNLDGVGMGPALELFRSESGLVRSFDPDPGLVAAVDAVSPVHRAWYPGTTDARAFLEAGIPALNLSSNRPDYPLPRGMHSRADALARVDLAALDSTLDTLTEVAHRLDTGSP